MHSTENFTESLTEPFTAQLYQLLPHADPMHFIESVLKVEEDSIACQLRVSHPSLIGWDQAQVPVAISIEYLAQAIALHGAHHSLKLRETAEPGVGQEVESRKGYIVSLRNVRFGVEYLERGSLLKTIARRIAQSDSTSVFDCSLQILDANDLTKPLAEARITIFHPAENLPDSNQGIAND